jgi:hypothetical protein
MEILREVPGETGVLLWQAYRNVMFWATAEPQDRGKLFAADAGQHRLEDLLSADAPGGIVDALVAVGRLLSAPETTSGDTIADACRTIADWAGGEGYGSTALSFAQAAALASPRTASYAFNVGRMARERGEMPRAETWFRHTIMIARQTGDWESYGRAYLSLGNMARERGNNPLAQRMHIKALRSGKRKGLSEIIGFASHELFVVATVTGRNEQADHFARQAFRAYGPEHRLLPALAHDIAYFWMDQGYFARALPVMEALLPLFPEQKEQFRIQSNILLCSPSSPTRSWRWRVGQPVSASGTAPSRSRSVLLRLRRRGTHRPPRCARSLSSIRSRPAGPSSARSPPVHGAATRRTRSRTRWCAPWSTALSPASDHGDKRRPAGRGILPAGLRSRVGALNGQCQSEWSCPTRGR